MMRFEYNRSCSLEDRIKMVVEEITDEFPKIDKSKAKIIASLVRPIDFKVTNDDIFERYYYTLMIIGKDHPAFIDVFKGLIDTYIDGLTNNYFKKTIPEMLKYAYNDRLSFPLLSEFY